MPINYNNEITWLVICGPRNIVSVWSETSDAGATCVRAASKALICLAFDAAENG